MTSAMRSWRIQNPAVEISFILIRTMAEKIHGDGGDNTGSHVHPPLSLISAVRASTWPCRGRGQEGLHVVSRRRQWSGVMKRAVIHRKRADRSLPSPFK